MDKQVTKETLDAAVSKALLHLEVGPIKTLYGQLDTALEKAGVTREQMLARADRSVVPTQGLAAKYPVAANDSGLNRDEYLDGLSRVCRLQESLRQAATIYAASLLQQDQHQAIHDTGVTLARSVEIMAENVEYPAVFGLRKSRVHLRQHFATAMEAILGMPIPGLQVGIERFEQAVRNEFREKSI